MTMSQLNIAICEDEPVVLHHITQVIQSEFQMLDLPVTIQSYKKPELLALQLKKGVLFNILFLDIDMPSLNGIELAKLANQMISKAFIIFISSKEEMVYQSFRVRPFRFIRKFEFNKEIHACITDIVDEFSEQINQEYLIFSSQNALFRLNIHDIIYIESIGKMLRIVMKEKELEVRYVLSDMENQLKPYHFMRIHKSFLVNRTFIFSIETKEILLTNGVSLPLSRYRAKETKQKFQEMFLCNLY